MSGDLSHTEEFIAVLREDAGEPREMVIWELEPDVYHQRVKERAYMLWRSGYSADADTNWFEAERQLKWGVK